MTIGNDHPWPGVYTAGKSTLVCIMTASRLDVAMDTHQGGLDTMNTASEAKPVDDMANASPASNDLMVVAADDQPQPAIVSAHSNGELANESDGICDKSVGDESAKRNLDSGVQILGNPGDQEPSQEVPEQLVAPNTVVQTERNALVSRSNSLAISAIEDDNLRRRFGPEAHEDGLAARRAATVTIVSVLNVGHYISRHYKRAGGDKRRGSQYGAWCFAYLPHLGRKTCDRWRLAYEAFREFLAVDMEPPESAWENFQLTALYKLSAPGVTRQARAEALDQAHRKPITPKMAEAIIEQCGGQLNNHRGSESTTRQTATVDCSIDNVKVTVRYPVGADEENAIKSAISGLKKKLPATGQRLASASAKKSKGRAR